MTAATGERRPPILEESGLGPWRGRVAVIPITNLASHWGETQFEVRAEWTGPPMPGFPPSPVPVDSTDTYMTGDQELARAVARRAAEQLRRPQDDQPPDLRLIAQQLT